MVAQPTIRELARTAAELLGPYVRREVAARVAAATTPGLGQSGVRIATQETKAALDRVVRVVVAQGFSAERAEVVGKDMAQGIRKRIAQDVRRQVDAAQAKAATPIRAVGGAR